jgi:phosphohistidine phosphatase SixA
MIGKEKLHAPLRINARLLEQKTRVSKPKTKAAAKSLAPTAGISPAARKYGIERSEERQMLRLRLLLLCVLLMAAPVAIVAGQPAPPADLLDALRLGGYVIVLRHGATNADAAKDGMSNPNKKPTGERQLSDAGRAQAIAIGEGLRKLGIRVGVVMTSPLQRAVDTATLLGVGEVKVAPDLAEAGSAIPRAENDRRADILRKLVGYHSGPDNFVIVTHRLNLVEAFGEQLADMREGEAAVFEPDFTGDGYRVVARFQASDWDLLVQAARVEELSRASHCEPRKAGPHTD